MVPLDLNFIDRVRSRKEFFFIILIAYFSSGRRELESVGVLVANFTSA